MNPNQPFPDNRESPVGDAGGALPLMDVQRRLKRAQPRPVELDIEAIVRAASDMDQTVALPKLADAQASTHSYRWISAMAGAWACGAIAGALLTFLLLNRAASPESPSKHVAVSREQQPNVAETITVDEANGVAPAVRHDDPPPDGSNPWVPVKSTDFVALLAPYTREATPYGVGQPILRAGAFASNRTVAGELRFPDWTDAAPPDGVEASESHSEAPQGSTRRSFQKEPIAREQLLQELLGANPDSIL